MWWATASQLCAEKRICTGEKATEPEICVHILELVGNLRETERIPFISDEFDARVKRSFGAATVCTNMRSVKGPQLS